MKYVKRENNQESKDIFQKATNSLLGSIFLIFLSIILLYNVGKSILITSEKVEILNQAEKEVSDLRLNNLKLLTLSEYMTSDEYLETEARNRLNLSRNGETAFVVPEKVLERGILQVQQVLGGKTDTAEEQNWEIWYNFFLSGI